MRRQPFIITPGIALTVVFAAVSVGAQDAGAEDLVALAYDPQTAGGLLAAVPLQEASRCVAALRAAGYAEADVIGLVTERSGAPEPVAVDLTGDQVAAALAQSIRDDDMTSHTLRTSVGIGE